MKRRRGKTTKRVFLFRIILVVLIVAGLAFAAYAIFTPLAFDLTGDTLDPPGRGTVAEAPPIPLSTSEIEFQRWFSSITWQLPRGQPQDCWKVGGAQYDVDSIRYQAAFVGYATAAIGMRTPAYPGMTGRILKNIIERLIDRSAWSYIDGYWGDEPGFPDPCATENVMYTGHLLQVLALYESLTGDDHYRTHGFDLVWSDDQRVHYDTMKLAEVTARQIRENTTGGIACEPGLVFFACNNHPHIALTLLEKMGYGSWKTERDKWEKWALESYKATVGEAAIRLFYDQNRKLFCPIGLLGADAWSILWYAPWAETLEFPRQLWSQTRKRFDPAALISGESPTQAILPGQYCMRSVPPLVATISFLAPAARICGDAATANTLDGWLDRHFLKTQGGRTYLEINPDWKIGVTANRALSLAIANGSDVRRMVQVPVSRSYFQGPLLHDVQPESVSVYQAYQSGKVLVLEIDGNGDDCVLSLKNIPRIRRIEGLTATDWKYESGRLHLPRLGRRTIRIHP